MEKKIATALVTMLADGKPQATAWGRMIRIAREAAIPRLSVPAAARKAKISKETWGNVERGYQLDRNGYRPVAGTPSTVAHMAHVVGLTADRLTEAGNPEAAEILAEIRRDEPERPSGYADPTLDYLSRTPGLPDDMVHAFILVARSYRERGS